MSKRDFFHLWARRSEETLVCVGLDSDPNRIPWQHLRCDEDDDPLFGFNRKIVEATADVVGAYKINTAFYGGSRGKSVLRKTVFFIHAIAPEVPVIIDCKAGDTADTNLHHVQELFDYIHADAVTVNPYVGGEALAPFLARKEKSIFVLCHTSNPGAGEFQDLEIFNSKAALRELLNGPARRLGYDITQFEGWMPLYERVAHRVANHWNINGNCGLVIGATYPKELARIRARVGDIPILVPAIGAQGGDIEGVVASGCDSRGAGLIISASQSIIFVSAGEDFAEAARNEALRLRDLINSFRGARIKKEGETWANSSC